MGNIGDPILTDIPLVGSTGPDYATDYNAIMTEVLARLTSRIPFSSLLLSSALDLNGQAILNAAYITYLDSVSTPSASPINRWTAFNGDAYWVGPAGPVQITSGAALAAASIGGIEGDYGGVNPAKVRYNAASTRYEFYHNYATATWANLRGRGVDIAAGPTSAVMAQLRYGGAGTQTFTLPATVPVPSNTAFVTISDTGQLGHSGTVTQDITLGGTTVIKHGDRSASHGVFPFIEGGTISLLFPGDIPTSQVSSSGIVHFQILGLEEGQRLKSILFHMGSAGTEPTYSLQRIGRNPLTVDTEAITMSTPSTGMRLMTLNTPYTYTSADSHHVIKFTANATNTADFHAFTRTFDRP